MIKYLMCHADVNKAYSTRMMYRKPRMTGLFCWLDVFNSNLITIRDYHKGDAKVVHINLCKATIDYPRILKERDPDVTVVSNVDYDVDMMIQYGGHEQFLQAINNSDIAFVNTLFQKDAFQQRTDKELHYIPHPCDTENLRAMRKDKKDRNGIGLMFHSKYGQDENQAGLISSNLKIDTHLFHTIHPVNQDNFDYIWSPMEFNMFINLLNNRLIAFDGHRDLAYGRFQCECAGLGIPCIGPQNVESQNLLFPDLTLPHHNDYYHAVELVIKLLEEPDFYTKVIEYADDKLRFYSYDNCRAMFMEMVNKKDNGLKKRMKEMKQSIDYCAEEH